MPRGFLPGHVPEVFASALWSRASKSCLSGLPRPNVRGFRDEFEPPTPSGEPYANRPSVAHV
jgi:hypothetical protein